MDVSRTSGARRRTAFAARSLGTHGILRATRPSPTSEPREQTPRAHGRDAETRRAGSCQRPASARRTVMALMADKPTTDTTIRPFTVEIPQADLDDLRARIAATRWPSKELVADRSQGVQLPTLQELARYWT